MTYEPTRTFSVKEFRVVVQPFHKKFASAERPLLLTHTAPDIKHISENQRIKFLNVITDDKVTADLPFYFGAVYHNFKGKADKRVIILPAEGDSDASAMNSKVSHSLDARIRSEY